MRILAAAVVVVFLQGAPRTPDVPFAIHAIDGGASETAAVADLNDDGRLDMISGEFWYEAPGWTKHRFRDVGFSSNYIDSFSILPLDVDADGLVDIVDVSWFAKKIAWWRNPGSTARSSPWREGVVNACCNIEFAVIADVDNDGQAREIVAQENGTAQSWYEARAGAWIKHVISDRDYGHGIGVGDVNRDSRNDILTPRGWLEAPADPRAEGLWTFHADWESINRPAASEGPPAAAAVPMELGFMHVVDVDGDGRNDVLAAAGHDYGVFWFQQGESGRWTRRVIDSAWSQGHASTLVDLDGNGRLDLVTGKRFMAHNGADPGEREPLGLYWYESRQVPSSGRRGGTGVEWIRHLISYGGQVGAGMQIPVIDIDRDGDLDIVVAGKSGLFLIENLEKPARR
jgi:hypothetical protein